MKTRRLGRRILVAGATLGLAAAAATASVPRASAQPAACTPLTEGFDNITTLSGAGWFTQNNSSPVGTTGWFQGNPNVFPAHTGATNSYIGANFNNTTGSNTISNWLLIPSRELRNGDTFRFWTRVPTDSPFPDRLEVRMSTNGASTNVGSTSTSVGDFTTLLLSINPNLQVGGYPQVWTQYNITLSGLPNPGPTAGRIAFRYFVTSGGPTGGNSNYIGIDTVEYVCGVPTGTAMNALSATRMAAGTLIRWRTLALHPFLGFHVYAERNGVRERVSKKLIPARAGAHGYSYLARPSASRSRYWVRAVGRDGSSTWLGPVSPR